MKKTAILIVLCASLLVPGTARADDGGFWDMLFHWGTKFSGYGIDFHLLCMTKEGRRITDCEEKFTKLGRLFDRNNIEHHFAVDGQPLTSFAEIKHEINLRTTYYHSYGETIPQELLAPGETAPNRVHAFKVMGMYYWRPSKYLDLGGGAGILPVFGDGIKPFWRGIFTPASVIIAPKGVIYGRVEVSFLTGRLEGEDWGARAFSLEPQANWSFALGFDLRRVGRIIARTP